MRSVTELTYSVAEVCDDIRALLGEALGSVWVSGEVSRLRPSPRGHVYFELVEKGEGDEVLAKLDAVIWRSDAERVRRALAASGQELAEGHTIRCRAGVDFYPPGGRLQLVVREVDPVFSLGLLAKRRAEVLAELAASGALDRNRQLHFPPLPLVIGLITSEGSAAYHDFLATLEESGYGFHVVLVHSSVQGKSAEAELAAALAALSRSRRAIDCAVIVRGGGSRTDLAVFDSREVALAIAGAPFPVITGLGHEIDESIADRVAHTAVKTPTKAAELLVAAVRECERAIAAAVSRLALEVPRRLAIARKDLAVAERGMRAVRGRLERDRGRVRELGRGMARIALARLGRAREGRRLLAERLRGAAPRMVARQGTRPGIVGATLVAAARGHLRTARAVLAGVERLCAELAPQRTLERGFSLTRDRDGRIVRDPAAAVVGSVVTTETAGGTFASRVETR